MHTLASFFVFLVAAANLVVPHANLPQVLGVEADSTSSATLVPTSTATGAGSPAGLSTNFGGDIEAKRKAASTDFQSKLQVIRDEKRKQVVSNLNDKLGNREQKWCTHWSEVVDRLNDILGRVKTRRDKAKAAGKDVTLINTAIANADAAIASAKQTAASQCAKTYTIQITTDANLGQSVKATISQFETDIKAVFTAMNAARDALKLAIQSLQGIAGIDDIGKSTATPSGGLNAR